MNAYLMYALAELAVHNGKVDPALTAALKDTDATVRNLAQAALQRIKGAKTIRFGSVHRPNLSSVNRTAPCPPLSTITTSPDFPCPAAT